MAAKAAKVVDLGQNLESLKRVPVTVAGREVLIGRLGLGQWIGLTQLAARKATQMDPTEAKEWDDKVKGQDAQAVGLTDLAGNVGFLLKMLDEDMVAELYSILTGLDKSLLRRTFSMAEFITVLGALNQTGELPEVWAAFNRVVKGS